MIPFFSKGGGLLREYSYDFAEQRSDMKQTLRMYPWIPRMFFIILAIVAAILWFLFFPLHQPQQQNSSQFYHNLSYWSRESALAADELEPDRYSFNVPNISKADVSSYVEAEEIKKLGTGVRIGEERKGFQGTGYVYNLPKNTASAFVFPVSVPATQHYDITICMAADSDVENALRVGENLLTHFTMQDTGTFTRVTFYGIFLERGQTSIAIDAIDGGLDIDYLEMTNDTSVYDVQFDIEKSPCNPNATEETKKLYSFLVEQWGKRMITGQYASDNTNRELSLIYEMTGQLPVIRFGELGSGNDLQQIEAAMDWHIYTGGVVGFMWHWNAPGTNSVFDKECNYNLNKALYAVDVNSVAKMPLDKLKIAAENGLYPEKCYELLKDIDEISEQLKKLANMDIPVLWRPLHEASGGWYWWGASGDVMYTQLWQLVYQRMTYYHHLDNLIWIWNGQSTSFLVPENTYDIASVDVYLSEKMAYGSRYEQYLSLCRITDGKKLLALSECSALPSMEMMLLDNTLWSFFGLWYGEYLMDSNGNFNDKYYSSSDLYNLYNSDSALCLNDFLALCK